MIPKGGLLSYITNLVYPVGSIYISVNNTNPQTYMTGTTWIAWGSGKVPIGVDSDDSSFSTVEKIGGSKTHLHKLPIAIDNAQDNWNSLQWNNSFGYGTTSITSANYNQINNTSVSSSKTMYQLNSQTVTALPPYITCYMWKRTV